MQIHFAPAAAADAAILALPVGKDGVPHIVWGAFGDHAQAVADQATTLKQRPCWRSAWSSTMAASKRKVATIEVTATTPSQTLKVPISAGVHRRVRRGATSIGNACAPVAPARTVMTFL